MKRICGILSTLILLAMAIIAAALILPHFFGYQTMAVLSGSMEPSVGVGSIAYVKEAKFEDLKKGDIISFRLSSDTVVTHRIIEIDKEKKEMLTKGDANDVIDAVPVPYREVIGKMGGCIPYLGYISIYAKTPLGIAGICAIFLILIVLIFLPEVLGKNEEKKEDVKSRVV